MQPAWVRGGLLPRDEPHLSAACRQRCGSADRGQSRAAASRGTQRHRQAARHSDRCWRSINPAAAASDAQALFADDGSSSSDSSGGDGDMRQQHAQQTDTLDPAAAERTLQESAAAAAQVVSPEAARRRLKRAADLLQMVHLMAPSSPDTFNRALVIWCAPLQHVSACLFCSGRN